MSEPFQPTLAAQQLADSCGRFVREVEDISGEAHGLQRPITLGAGEVVIREFLIPRIGKKKKGQAQVSWVMRNLTGRKIQEGLAAECLDVGIASGLAAGGPVKVVDLLDYGMKLLLPEHEKPTKTEWKRLKDIPVVLMDGDRRFRQHLAGCERENGVNLRIGGECTSYPQAVDLAEVVGWAVIVLELWWNRRKDWKSRTQVLPGLDTYQRTLQLGWNRNVLKRRVELELLVKALRGKR